MQVIIDFLTPSGSLKRIPLLSQLALGMLFAEPQQSSFSFCNSDVDGGNCERHARMQRLRFLHRWVVVMMMRRAYNGLLRGDQVASEQRQVFLFPTVQHSVWEVFQSPCTTRLKISTICISSGSMSIFFSFLDERRSAQPIQIFFLIYLFSWVTHSNFQFSIGAAF